MNRVHMSRSNVSRDASLPAAVQHLIVPCRHGLHMRVCAAVVEVAMRYRSDIFLASSRKQANAKSVLQLLGLGATDHQPLQLVVQGPDAAEASRAVSALFESGIVLCGERLESDE